MAAGFSLAEAAAITGLAARTIESIEAGRQAPTQAMSRRLARLVAAVGLLD
jgi:transcriptional regulator with XRE-family HTH domain